MSNDIMDLLELYDEDSEVIESTTEGNIKSVTISKIKREMYCRVCGCRLHSKGTFTRHPNNQIFQGSYVLKVTLIGRRWECSNPDCNYKETDQFKFIQRYKHNTTFNDISMIQEMKDITLSCRQPPGRCHRQNGRRWYCRLFYRAAGPHCLSASEL